MDTDFLNHFKGKVKKIGKNAYNDIINTNSKPILKPIVKNNDNFKYNSNGYDNYNYLNKNNNNYENFKNNNNIDKNTNYIAMINAQNNILGNTNKIPNFNMNNINNNNQNYNNNHYNNYNNQINHPNNNYNSYYNKNQNYNNFNQNTNHPNPSPNQIENNNYNMPINNYVMPKIINNYNQPQYFYDNNSKNNSNISNENRTNSFKSNKNHTNNNYYSKQNTYSEMNIRNNEFRPYNYDEYKTLSKTQNTKLGGLGPNFNDNWYKKKRNKDKMKNYADVIKNMNNKKLNNIQKKPISHTQIKRPSKREKALEFAKNLNQRPSLVNKPKRPEKLVDKEIINVEDHIKDLELKHKFYIDKLKLNNKLK